MVKFTREGVSLLLIRYSLGIGGSFLAGAFALEAFSFEGFMIPAAVFVFISTALIVYAFGRIRLHIFSLAVLAWLVVLILLLPPPHHFPH